MLPLSFFYKEKRRGEGGRKGAAWSRIAGRPTLLDRSFAFLDVVLQHFQKKKKERGGGKSVEKLPLRGRLLPNQVLSLRGFFLLGAKKEKASRR